MRPGDPPISMATMEIKQIKDRIQSTIKGSIMKMLGPKVPPELLLLLLLQKVIVAELLLELLLELLPPEKIVAPIVITPLKIEVPVVL